MEQVVSRPPQLRRCKFTRQELVSGKGFEELINFACALLLALGLFKQTIRCNIRLHNVCIAGIDLGVASGIAPFGRPISYAKIYLNSRGFPTPITQGVVRFYAYAHQPLSQQPSPVRDHL